MKHHFSLRGIDSILLHFVVVKHNTATAAVVVIGIIGCRGVIIVFSRGCCSYDVLLVAAVPVIDVAAALCGGRIGDATVTTVVLFVVMLVVVVYAVVVVVVVIDVAAVNTTVSTAVVFGVRRSD